MGKIITLTEVGGQYYGPEEDTPRNVNSDEIKSLKKPSHKQLGTTVVVLEGKKRLFVKETEDEIKSLINDDSQKGVSFYSKWIKFFKKN